MGNNTVDRIHYFLAKDDNHFGDMWVIISTQNKKTTEEEKLIALSTDKS